jgi:hypothetical protein
MGTKRPYFRTSMSIKSLYHLSRLHVPDIDFVIFAAAYYEFASLIEEEARRYAIGPVNVPYVCFRTV